MFSSGLSRPFGVGAVSAEGVMPLLVPPSYILIFLTAPESMVPGTDRVLAAIVALNAAVQLLAAVGAVGMYWVPRLLLLQRIDGYRVRPAGGGMLVYLALFPPAAVAIGLTWQQGNVPGWYFLLGGASWVLVVPALADLLLRGRFGADSVTEPGPQQLGSGPAGDLLPVGDFDLRLPGR